MFKITKWCASITDDNKDRIIEVAENERKTMPYIFRLLDDDGIIYAEGISSTNDDQKAFRPLDRYQNDYGCTEIQYLNDGEWETL